MSTVNMGALVYDVGMEEDPATKRWQWERRRAEYNRGFHSENRNVTECSPSSQVLRPGQRRVRAQESDNVTGRVAKLGLLEPGKPRRRLRPAGHLPQHV